jgi:hypothetical protein
MPAPQLYVQQAPTRPFDMAYGANPITLSGITPAQDKYALRVYVLGNPNPIADIRQTPNRVGRAIFDIQNILQAYVSPTKNNIDALGVTGFGLQIANGELIEYQIGYTTETNGTLDDPFLIDPIVYTTIAGAKEYWQVPFVASKYQAAIQSDINGCTILNPSAKPVQASALSDVSWTIKDTETSDDFLADGWASPTGIDVHNVYEDDQCTKSFFQPTNRGGSMPPVFNAQGIDAFIVAEYNAAGQMISETQINNTVAVGGGPNNTLGQGLVPTGNFKVVTISCGPANTPGFNLQPATTHYYLMAMVYSPVTPACGGGGLLYTPAWKAQRFNIIQEPCNDYDHIQFAWLNSLGYRDQFTFTKKNEKKINTERNNFLQEVADYNSTSYAVNKQSRGFTTYSQNIKEVWEATSGYMNDMEAELLESMFKSPSVMVRFSTGEYANQWIPINLISSSYIQKTYRKDRLFQYTVNYKLASNIKSQRG